MTIMAHYRYVAGGLVFVGQLMLWAECIAPNDFDPICRTDFRYRVAHDWIPYANDTSSGTWKVLIDQYDYENLLNPGPPPKVWSVKDVDGTGTTVRRVSSDHVTVASTKMQTFNFSGSLKLFMFVAGQRVNN